MKILDNAAVVASLAASTGKPHMLIEATASGVRTLRNAGIPALPDAVIDALGRDGATIVSFGTFVSAALDFWDLEQALLSNRIQGVTLRLAQPDGTVRIHDGVDAVIVSMPLRAAA